ncbi:MAG: nuclear transport factor 2 family protein [Chromatiaceae bacterium]|nr:MAG: nuclear transport factor 2 family protein [Chromatiaceae bacterium]
MSNHPLALVERYLDALQDHDYDRARHCLADRDFHYESPIGSYDSADEFVRFVALSGGILQRIERRHCFVDGDHVCHWLVLVTQLSEHLATAAVQWAQVRAGRIARIELLFDAHRYRLLFPENASDA